VFSYVSMGGSQLRADAAVLEARRLRAIGMVGQGASQAEVARQLNVSREAVRQWVDAYVTGGAAALASRPRRKRGRIPIDDVRKVVERAGAAARRLTTSRVREVILRTHGVAYSASSVRGILRRLGYAFTRDRGWHRSDRSERRLDSQRRHRGRAEGRLRLKAG
jgi:transposase